MFSNEKLGFGYSSRERLRSGIFLENHLGSRIGLDTS